MLVVLLLLMFSEICCGGFQQCGIVSESPESIVAATAKKLTSCTCGMVVINRQFAGFSAKTTGFFSFTDSTTPPLLMEQYLIVVNRQSINTKFLSSAKVARTWFTLMLVSVIHAAIYSEMIDRFFDLAAITSFRACGSGLFSPIPRGSFLSNYGMAVFAEPTKTISARSVFGERGQGEPQFAVRTLLVPTSRWNWESSFETGTTFTSSLCVARPAAFAGPTEDRQGFVFATATAEFPAVNGGWHQAPPYRCGEMGLFSGKAENTCGTDQVHPRPHCTTH